MNHSTIRLKQVSARCMTKPHACNQTRQQQWRTWCERSASMMNTKFPVAKRRPCTYAVPSPSLPGRGCSSCERRRLRVRRHHQLRHKAGHCHVEEPAAGQGGLAATQNTAQYVADIIVSRQTLLLGPTARLSRRTSLLSIHRSSMPWFGGKWTSPSNEFKSGKAHYSVSAVSFLQPLHDILCAVRARVIDHNDLKCHAAAQE